MILTSAHIYRDGAGDDFWFNDGGFGLNPVLINIFSVQLRGTVTTETFNYFPLIEIITVCWFIDFIPGTIMRWDNRNMKWNHANVQFQKRVKSFR